LVKYGCGDGIIEVIIRDELGRKIEHFKMNLNDKLMQLNIFRKLRDKYELAIDSEIKFPEKSFFEY